jgi:hypothetical protein
MAAPLALRSDFKATDLLVAPPGEQATPAPRLLALAAIYESDSRGITPVRCAAHGRRDNVHTGPRNRVPFKLRMWIRINISVDGSPSNEWIGL